MLEFEGPCGRYNRARYELDNPDAIPCADVWVIKLKQMITQRRSYDDMVSYADNVPLYNLLFTIFEDNSQGSVKHLLEAMLVTGETYSTIKEKLNHPMVKSSLFVSLYHELFYQIRPYLDNEIAMYRYVIQPMSAHDSDRIAFGPIWKLLAYCGGMKVLLDSGLGRKPIGIEDLDLLMQMGAMRNASLMMQYISTGKSFFLENPVAFQVVDHLVTMDSNRSLTRDKAGFRRIVESNESEYSNLLTDHFKMVYMPKKQKLLTGPEKIEDDKAACKEGILDPKNAAAIEQCTTTKYTE